MTRAQVLVIGAGPHGLTAARYLLRADPALAGRLAVADPCPWMAAWDEVFTRLRLPRLRSGQVHHPDPRPFALRVRPLTTSSWTPTSAEVWNAPNCDRLARGAPGAAVQEDE